MNESLSVETLQCDVSTIALDKIYGTKKPCKMHGFLIYKSVKDYSHSIVAGGLELIS